MGTDEEDGQVKWQQQLCLSHVRLRSTSVAVLQVQYRPNNPAVTQDTQLGSTGADIIAWGFTKIVQVCSCQTLLVHLTVHSNVASSCV